MRTGRLEVFVGGERINEVGPGDVVGEIGVVGRRPRTATVIAATDVELWRLPGGVFLSAIEMHPVMPDALRRGIADRLATRLPRAG